MLDLLKYRRLICHTLLAIVAKIIFENWEIQFGKQQLIASKVLDCRRSNLSHNPGVKYVIIIGPKRAIFYQVYGAKLRKLHKDLKTGLNFGCNKGSLYSLLIRSLTGDLKTTLTFKFFSAHLNLLGCFK